MILFKCPAVSQTPFSCWLYAPSICAAPSNDQLGFEAAKKMFLSRLNQLGYKQADLLAMEEKGLDLDKKQKILTDMGLKKIGSFHDLLKFDDESKIALYQKLSHLLKTHGPLIVEHPAFGFISTHESAFVGVIMAENSETHKKEVFLLINETMSGRLTATPFTDFIDITNMRNRGTDSRGGKEETLLFALPKELLHAKLYSGIELKALTADILKMSPGGIAMNLRKDFLSAGFDVLFVPPSTLFSQANNITLVSPLYIGKGNYDPKPTIDVSTPKQWL